MIQVPLWLGNIQLNEIVGMPVDPKAGQDNRFFALEESSMLLLGLGIVLLAMKYLEFGVVAGWDWWVVLAPFALAVVWWAWADWSGYTKKKAMEKENVRKAARIEKNRQQLGLSTKRRR